MDFTRRAPSSGFGSHAGKAAKGNIRPGRDNPPVVMGHAVNIAAGLQNAPENPATASWGNGPGG